MKLTHLATLALGGLALAACATSPPRSYGPGPQVPVGTSGAVAERGQIAQCGHRGAEQADVIYPEGWQQRLNESAQQQMSNDELLGGPVTTEVVARNDTPVSPPTPSYPQAMASQGQEGVCYALMDVTPAGNPDEILTACSAPAFNASAFQAAQSMTFAPKVVDGRQVRRLNVVYPIEYCLQ